MYVQGMVGYCPKEAITLRSITSFMCRQSGNVKSHNHPKAQTFKIGETDGKKKNRLHLLNHVLFMHFYSVL